jgi:hypothetical protein
LQKKIKNQILRSLEGFFFHKPYLEKHYGANKKKLRFANAHKLKINDD